MSKPTLTVVGVVTYRREATSKAGKPYVAFTVATAPRRWNNREYSTKVEVRCYRPDAVTGLAQGAWVTASGECDAEMREYDGKRFARLVVMATPVALPVVAAPPAAAAGESSPAPPQRTAPADYADDADPGQP
jgi:hypothetical protein